MKGSTAILVAAIGGLSLGLAGPPLDLLPALWGGMAVLAWTLSHERPLPAFASRARVLSVGARRGLAFGAAANVAALRFVPGVITKYTVLPWAVGLLALVLLALFEGLRWALAAVACETLARARVPRPLAFAGGVYAGTFLPTMMPWTVAGGASPWPAMVQLADVCGERGVAALMAVTAGLVAAAAESARVGDRRRGGLLGAGAVALLVAQVGFGAARVRAVDEARAVAPHVEVGLIQPGVPPTLQDTPGRAPAILDTLTSLTKRAEERGAQLTVWPEGAFPYALPHGAPREPVGVSSILQPGVHGPVITGVITVGGRGRDDYNSALVASRAGGLSVPYDKRHLLWFGETVPLADRFPFLRDVFGGGEGLTRGEREVSLTTGGVRAAVLICYEDTLPEASLDAATLRPNLLVNITEDGWFASPESELHARLAALRAVELRRDLVRAVEGGVPSWVGASGRLLAHGSADLPGVIVVAPALLESPITFYARFGDAPWMLLALVLANAAIWRAATRARALAR